MDMIGKMIFQTWDSATDIVFDTDIVWPDHTDNYTDMVWMDHTDTDIEWKNPF